MHTLPKLQIHITPNIHLLEWSQQRWMGSWKGSAGMGKEKKERKAKDGKGLTGYRGISSSNANSIIVYQRKSPLSLFLIYNNDIHIWQSFLVSEKLLQLMWLMSIWSRNLSSPQHFPHLIRLKGGVNEKCKFIYRCLNGMIEVKVPIQTHQILSTPIFCWWFHDTHPSLLWRVLKICCQDADGYINPIEMKAVLKLFLPLGEVSIFEFKLNLFSSLSQNHRKMMRIWQRSSTGDIFIIFFAYNQLS